MQNADIRADAGLDDLLDLIRNAEFVITDSFHTTIFSIIFRKQFFVFQRFKDDNFTSQNMRIYSLLEMANLQDRLISYQSSIIDVVPAINYSDLIQKLNKKKKKSKGFLNKSIII